jgi:hypothetical protein
MNGQNPPPEQQREGTIWKYAMYGVLILGGTIILCHVDFLFSIPGYKESFISDYPIYLVLVCAIAGLITSKKMYKLLTPLPLKSFQLPLEQQINGNKVKIDILFQYSNDPPLERIRYAATKGISRAFEKLDNIPTAEQTEEILTTSLESEVAELEIAVFRISVLLVQATAKPIGSSEDIVIGEL